MAERLNAESFAEKAFPDGRLSVIDFYSDSCIPCKRLAPLLADLEESYADKLYIGRVNIAYEKELVEKYEVTAAPTLLFFKNGQEVARHTGAAKKQALTELIEQNL